MAEPTSTLEYDDLRKAVGVYLGYGRTTANWTTEQQAQILDSVKNGISNFYNVREWSFLKPINTVTLYADIAVDSGITATCIKDNGTSTVTATDDAFYPEMVGRDIVFTKDGSTYTYEILSYTSATVITVACDTSMVGSNPFAVSSLGRFRLPDNFGGIEGPLTFEPNDGYTPITVRSEKTIRDLRQGGSSSGRPAIIAVRPLPFVATVGQRHEMTAWPTPNTDYVMSYKMIYAHDVVSAANKYVLGGARHSQTIRESCLREAEITLNDEIGIHDAKYKELLADSVANDQNASSPESLGYNSDLSDGVDYTPELGTGLTYKGVDI